MSVLIGGRPAALTVSHWESHSSTSTTGLQQGEEEVPSFVDVRGQRSAWADWSEDTEQGVKLKHTKGPNFLTWTKLQVNVNNH